MNKIALWKNVRADDRTAELAIIASTEPQETCIRSRNEPPIIMTCSKFSKLSRTDGISVKTKSITKMKHCLQQSYTILFPGTDLEFNSRMGFFCLRIEWRFQCAAIYHKQISFCTMNQNKLEMASLCSFCYQAEVIKKVYNVLRIKILFQSKVKINLVSVFLILQQLFWGK